jgi:F-type H+-transporting ATPase subunit epsilon
MPLEVHVVTPEREVWSGEARMVIARGVDGEVGILPGHAPLLVRLAIGHLRVQTNGEDFVSVVDGGFLHVTSSGDLTRVDVLAAGAALRSEIDLERERRRADEMERRLAVADDAGARAEVAKALARINLPAR